MARGEHHSKATTTIDLGRMRTRLRAAGGRIALAVGLAALAVGGLVALRAQPSVVEARLLVEPRAVPGETAGDRLRREDRIVAAQIDLLGSAALARRVIAAAPEVAARALAADEAAGFDRDGGTAEERRAAALREALAVERIDRSRLLALRLTSLDADAAGRLVGLVAREETASLEETRTRIRAEVDRRFAADLAAARARLAEAEAAAAEPAPAIASAEESAEARLRADRTAAEVRLTQLEAFAAAGEGGAERAVDAAPTPGLKALRDKRGALRARLAELSAIYLGNHPLMKEAEADLSDLRTRIRAELPRAIAAEKAELADLDRRLAALAVPAVEPVAPAVSDVEPARAALADLEARRDAARVAALGDAAVDVRLLGSPDVVVTPSPRPALLAGGLAGLLVLIVGLALVARAAGRDVRRAAASPEGSPARRADPVFPEAAPSVEGAAPVPPAAAPESLVPRDPDAPRRAAAYGAAARGLVPELWERLAEEFPAGLRVVVVSTADAARAHAAARALAAVAARTAIAGLVDLAGTLVDPDETRGEGLCDLLDGRVAFSEVLRRDGAGEVWSVPVGGRRLAEADLVDPGFEGVLEALASTWDVLIADAGRLVATPGLAALLERADAVVLAEDASEDPRALRVLETLLEAGKPTWMLEPPPETIAAAPETDADEARASEPSMETETEAVADWARAA